jgi:[acyl-carrier-protein] S-malonyltransferase
MGQSLYEKSGEAREAFDRADEVLGFGLRGICFEGPEERLNQTDISQPAIYVTSVASFRTAQAAGVIEVGSIAACAGLSLGEYTALHLAGTFSFEEGLKLVAARGRYMQEAAEGSPSGMVALLGADEARVNELCRDAAADEVLVPANYNAPGQIVISGSIGACERAVKLAEAAGLKAAVLKVAGAFHSPLMQPAANGMAAELERVTFSPLRVPVYSNVTAQPHGEESAIKRLLVQQIVSPVRWEQTARTLLAIEGARFIELSPGRTLAGLAKRINRRLPILSVDNADSIVAAQRSQAQGS